MEPTEIIREVTRSHLRPDSKQIHPVGVREVREREEIYLWAAVVDK